jgi:hypothetical protein
LPPESTIAGEADLDCRMFSFFKKAEGAEETGNPSAYRVTS